MGSPFVGELRVFSFNFPPRGWAECNGQTLSIQQNTALFSLLGTTYGGNGTTTFLLPNLQGRVPVHVGGGLTLGQSAGEEAHTLQSNEMAQHTHIVQASGNPASSSDPQGNVLATPASDLYGTSGSGPVVGLASSTVTPVGGNQAHENRQPYLTLTICIALQGIFPTRN